MIGAVRHDLGLLRRLAGMLSEPKPGTNRGAILTLAGLLILRGLLEAFSLGALILFVVHAGLGPQPGGPGAKLHAAMERLGLPFDLAFVGVIALFVVKNLLYARLLAIRSRLRQEWMRKIGDTLYRQYQDSTFQGRGRAALAHYGGTLSGAVTHTVNGYLSPLIDAVAEIAVIIALAAILLSRSIQAKRGPISVRISGENAFKRRQQPPRCSPSDHSGTTRMRLSSPLASSVMQTTSRGSDRWVSNSLRSRFTASAEKSKMT